jgi:jumonji domain-containing protein 7
VPWVQDLHLPDSVRPITVTLEKGESLYLPAGWWHKVEQNEGPGGLAVAVN